MGAQSKCTWAFHKSHFVWKFTGKMPDSDSGDIVLCEPAQSKRTWTFEKSHLWKCTGKMPDAPETTSIKHRGLTLTVRTPQIPQCGHTVWGKNAYTHVHNRAYTTHFVGFPNWFEPDRTLKRLPHAIRSSFAELGNASMLRILGSRRSTISGSIGGYPQMGAPP